MQLKETKLLPSWQIHSPLLCTSQTFQQHSTLKLSFILQFHWLKYFNQWNYKMKANKSYLLDKFISFCFVLLKLFSSTQLFHFFLLFFNYFFFILCRRIRLRRCFRLRSHIRLSCSISFLVFPNFFTVLFRHRLHCRTCRWRCRNRIVEHNLWSWFPVHIINFWDLPWCNRWKLELLPPSWTILLV